MTTTDVEIASNALVLLGEEPIEAFDDDTVPANTMLRLYARTYKSLLTRRRWTFASGQSQLSKLLTAPSSRYQIAYQLPANMLDLLSVDPDYIQYDIYGKKLYTDYDGELWIDHKYKPEENDLPDYFIEYMEAYLAMKAALPITEDVGKFNAMNALQKELAREARLADSKQRKNQGIKRFPLTQVRP